MLTKAVAPKDVNVTTSFRSVCSLYKRPAKPKLPRRALGGKQARFPSCFRCLKWRSNEPDHQVIEKEEEKKKKKEKKRREREKKGEKPGPKPGPMDTFARR